ncbi:MAG TPA: ABC transporter permease [Armatimonadota bacterium]|nr:ABC transporter permease [Armatimonadota bacterium]
MTHNRPWRINLAPFTAPVKTGFRELWSHKLRSLLTMLGMIFGVAAVIAMVSIGEGARQETLRQIQQLGIDTLQVRRVALVGEMQNEAAKKSPYGLSYGDALVLGELCDFAQRVVPSCRIFGAVSAGGKTVDARVFGTAPGYLETSHLDVREGRFIDDEDVARRAHVCVLGAEVKRDAFAFESPVGKFVKIGMSNFRVIGVMKERVLETADTTFTLRDLNQDVYIPITVAMEDFQLYMEKAIPMNPEAVMGLVNSMFERPPLNRRPISEIAVQVRDPDRTVPAAQVVKRIIEQRHGGVADFEIIIPIELLRQRQQTQNIFNVVMGAIASISLLVGGIGIMNIMLATVTQRAREIGVRRCIGAKRGDIVRQFLVECLVITMIGGLIGVGGGIGAAQAISHFAGWRTVVAGAAVALSLGVSVSVGLIFGLYPAIRASLIEPMEALRGE